MTIQSTDFFKESVGKNRVDLLSGLLSGLVVLYLLIALFPGISSFNMPELDTSWYYALSFLPQSGYTFGQDVFFTYGPLGYLLTPMPVGNSYNQGMAFRLVLHLLLGVLLGCYWWQTKNWRHVCVFVAAYLILAWPLLEVGVIILEVFADTYLRMISALLLVLGLQRERWLAAALLGCAGIASLLLFIKFNSGVAATAHFFFTGLLLVLGRRTRLKTVLASGAVYLVMLVGLAFMLLGSLGRLARWLQASL
jgi:hypothetical protein